MRQAGSSYGGAVALRVALEQPAKLQSLTLIEPVAFHLLRLGSELDRDLFRRVDSLADPVKEAINRGDHWGAMERFIDYWNGAGAWANLKQETRMSLASRARKLPLDFWSTSFEATPLQAYEDLALPTLLIRGEKAPTPTHRIVELLAETLPTVHERTVAGAGHMAPVTHADVVNRMIAEHLIRSAIKDGLRPVARPVDRATA